MSRLNKSHITYRMYEELKDDEFVDIPEYDGNYKINKKGEVWGKRYNKVLKNNLQNNGYYRVDLCKNKTTKHFSIHRLMGFTFLNLQQNQVVDHIDGDRLNNNLSNLRVCSRSQNSMNKRNVVGYFVAKNKNGSFRYEAYIVKDKKLIRKTFKTSEDAQKWRDENELEIYREFSPKYIHK